MNSAIVLDILNTIEILEYGLTAVEDLASTLSFWTSYVELPPSRPRLPASLLGGVNLRVSAETNNFSLILLEHHLTSEPTDTSLLPNIFRISFDASVVITACQTSESLSGSLQHLRFGTYRQVYSTYLPLVPSYSSVGRLSFNHRLCLRGASILPYHSNSLSLTCSKYFL